MAKLYFVRHGESQANKDGILAGSSDSPITDEGRRQAEREAEEIKRQHMSVDTIIASPLSRAAETAVIIAKLISFPIEDIKTIDDLHEKNSGSYEGQTTQDMLAASEADMRSAGGETLQVFAERVARSNDLVKSHAVGTTIVVGHSEWYRMAVCLENGWSPLDMAQVDRPLNATILEYPNF
ncbi:MAG: histidine phosphatase family protein [bacterium]|nr:histidine phosphatase family protein [bacterium]